MNSDINVERAAKIAELNDKYRQGLSFTITRGVQVLDDLIGLIQAVRDYSDFNEGNDPHGEHDFGVLYWHNDKIFWKIDYYDEAYETWHSPLSPDCHRVLTIMLAEEY